MKAKLPALLIGCLSLLAGPVRAQQKAYFVDGYHGGVWGHYPDWNTRFMVDQLKSHPDWKINIEIEPETWDKAQVVDPAAYAEFKELIKEQSAKDVRIEYVNPAYGQSYMYNIDGESIIRQFYYGMEKLKGHFPGIRFTSYSIRRALFYQCAAADTEIIWV
jgi:alpha-mannosidase